MNNNREATITKAGYIGIITNIFLVIFKMLIGVLSHSIAIVLDAVNNLTDVISSVVTIVGMKIASQKPDKDHPFGHGRVEYFSGFVVSIIIISTGIFSFIDVIKKIFQGTETPNYTIITTIIICISIIVKFILGKYCKNLGEKLNSNSLKGSGIDALNDALISISLLIGIIVYKIFNFSIDNYLGIIISLLIIKAGWDILSEIINDIMGSKPNSEIVKELKSTINSYDKVLGTYDLVLHNYGPKSAMGSVNLELPGELTCEEIHSITRKIQIDIIKKFHIFLTIGIYSVNTTNKHKIEIREKVKDIIQSFEGVINCHGVYVDEIKHYMSFDAMLDFTIHNKGEFVKILKNAVNEVYPEYEIDIKFDVNYSD